MLTQSGDVFVWWPSSGVMGDTVQQKMRDMDSEGDKKALPSQDGIIPCVTWDLDIMPTRLPALPSLPNLSNAKTENTSKSQTVQLIQIAGFDQHIIGLTDHGHVLKYGGLHSETDAPNGRWEYVSCFPEAFSAFAVSFILLIQILLFSFPCLAMSKESENSRLSQMQTTIQLNLKLRRR